MRFKIFCISNLAAFAILASQLFYLQIVKGESFWLLGQHNAIRIIPQRAVRGRILDTNGQILAKDRLALNLAVIPQDLKEKDVLFRELSQILDVEKQALELKFRKGLSAPFAPVVITRDLDKERALLIAEKVNKFSGLILAAEPIRVYPYGSFASHIMGYVGKPKILKENLGGYGFTVSDYVGLTGIEEYLDQFLRGRNGGMQIEVDNRGRQISLLGMRLPEKGASVKLTIDIRIQEVLEQALSAEQGAGILMNPFNGEILAIVSSPSFDPNAFVLSKDLALRENYLSDNSAPLFNRAISGQYPLGSVFKIVTVLAGLSTKTIALNTQFFCPGQKLIGSREFKCWSKHSDEDLKEAIIHSCNVYFYNVGIKTGAEALSEYAKIFDLGSLTNIDLPQEEPGLIPSPKWRRQIHQEPWYKGDTANLAIGQGGLLVTPIQVARMLAVIANSGYLVRPHLVKEAAEKKVIYKHPTRVNINPRILSFLKQALRAVVEEEDGTAHIIDMPDVEICAKTGTAQAGRGRKHGWIAGFAPQDAPKVVFVIFLEDSEGSSAANLVARKLFRQLREEKLLLWE